MRAGGVCALVAGLLLATQPARPASRAGEKPDFAATLHTPAARASVEAPRWLAADTNRRAVPDTARRTILPDSTATAPAPPETDRPTRKTVLFTVLAIAALTVATLLLYNVRSR